MKGIVFNLLEQAVISEHGEDVWDDLLEATGLEGAYTSLGNYEDAELQRLVMAAASALGRAPAEVERWLGRRSIPRLAALYPRFFEPHASTQAFLFTLNDVIHSEVRKIYPGASVPEFDFEQHDATRLALHYRSSRRMCAFAEGMVAGAADHFGEAVRIVQRACVERGDAACVLECSFGEDADG